ncbi:Uncharacterised protein [Streptococcus merionis]|uniref:Uncharacterized protein n=1 Tax=Streptococcus merionis TaxID=400065 RepID=A0A239SS44_9STRE|nr:Uncharacterised protein [Streptococcus merionis]
MSPKTQGNSRILPSILARVQFIKIQSPLRKALKNEKIDEECKHSRKFLNFTEHFSPCSVH